MKGAPVGINVMACRWPLNKTGTCSSLKPSIFFLGGVGESEWEWQFSTNQGKPEKNCKKSKIFENFFLTKKNQPPTPSCCQASPKDPKWHCPLDPPGQRSGAARFNKGGKWSRYRRTRKKRPSNQPDPVATGSMNQCWFAQLDLKPPLPKFTLPSQSSYVTHNFALPAQFFCLPHLPCKFNFILLQFDNHICILGRLISWRLASRCGKNLWLELKTLY